MDIAIKISQLNVNFAQHHILHNLNIEFNRHQITTIVGHSGSGKTTLLRALNRLNEEYEHCHTTGQIEINFGQNSELIYPSYHKKAMAKQDLRRKVGMLFQTPQLLPVSIYRNIAMPLELVAACPKQLIEKKIKEVLKRVDLWDEIHNKLNESAEHLSGGQQQRLCLARMLSLEPSILLLDEPTSALDIHTTKVIESLLNELRSNYTIVIVSHNLEQACRLADQLFIMHNGKITYHLKSPLELIEIKNLFGSTTNG